MAVKIQFEIGHTSKLKSKKTREGFTHDWELYVKGVNGADIGCFVEKVVFNLHDSFPKPKRVCKESPYMIQESGYAGFMLPIDIYLRNRDEPKMLQFNYDLALHTTGPPQHRSDIQKYIFENPSEEFRQKLMKGGGIPVAGVMPGSVATPLQPLGLGQEGHKSTSTESKKHKSRPDDGKVASFTDLFGTPLTKGISTASNKPSPDYRSGNSNQGISKPGTYTPQNSASNSLSKEKLIKEKSNSSVEKSKDRQERKEKHPKSSGSSPQKDGRSGESKSKHERRDKNEDKAKKDKVRDKDKERSREKNSSSINVLQNTTHGSSTTTNTGTSASSSLKRPNSPKREVSPRRNSPAGLINSGSIGTLNNTIGRPTSSNGGRIEADNKTTSIKSSSKDTAGSIEGKSKESKARDSSSSGKKSKKDRKERDKDKDRERDKEKQKSMDTTQARPHNNPAMMDTNTFNIDTNKSGKAGSMLNAGATNTNGNVEAVALKREKTSKAMGEKSNDKTISSSSNTTGGAPTSSSTSTPVLSLSQAEKGKNSSSNNSTSSTSSAAGGGSGVGGGSGAGTGSSTYSVEKDKQRSHKHKKREKNKDRDRDKERERDKDKDLKKEDKKEKEKNEKPIENKASTPNAMAKPLNSPSLPNLLEENKEATLTGSGAGSLNPTTSNSSNKKSQNKEKKSREKSSNREEKTKRKQGEIEAAAGKVKQIKISGTQAGQIAPTSSSSSSTSEHPPTTGTTTIVPLAQPSMDLSDNDSLPATPSAAVAVVPNNATSSSANEQGHIKNNNSNSSKNKVASNLNHSDSSNSGCSSDMPLKAPQTVNSSSNRSDATKMNAPPNSSSIRNAAKNLSNNKISKDKKAGDKAEKTDVEEKKRRRTSTVNNTFIEPPLKQMKRDKDSNKGNREKCNKSPSIRSGPTRTSSGSNSDVTNTFLQPSASPSSSSTAAAPLPAPSSANTTPNNTAHSPVLNAAEAVGNATSATVNAAISVNSATTQQQSQSATLQVAPAQNPLPTDYWTELQELQHKIMTLQDSEDLQHVVELIAATGCYEITTKTFDFDLCKLDRNTVQRLQEFFATSVA